MNKVKIKTQLFKVTIDNIIIYVLAYDIIHAMESISDNYWIKQNKNAEISVIQLTSEYGIELKVAKECLPQGLVDKIEIE